MRTVAFAFAICSFGILSGCNTVGSPLIFGKVNTFGATASATAPDQGGAVTIGYRSANIAIVPVTAVGEDGRTIKTLAVINDKTHGRAEDAFSTFAHFEATAGIPAKACLGDTFATGLAAQKVSENLAKVCP